MGVYLREKAVGKGMVSFYLDIYHNKTRWYEFLNIKINASRPSEQDKEKRRLAIEIRSKRENELIVQDNGLVDRSKRKADFIKWFEKYIEKKHKNNTHNSTTLAHLKAYMGKQPLSFVAITPTWLKGFTEYLFGKVSNNTARCYLMNMFSSLESAVIEEIISTNPFRKIPKNERIRQQNVFRQAYTVEQLQQLIDTPYKMRNPQIRQAFIFSCFTGLRWSDLNCLRWSEIIKKKIDGKMQYFIYFEQEKTEDIEYLPVSDQAEAIIKEREKAREEEPESPFVFPLIVEEKPNSLRVYNRVSYALKKWAKAAGFTNPEQMTFHTGRHTFATNVLESSEDGDLWTVSKLLGHKNINSTQIYAHVRHKKLKAAVKALPKLKVVHRKAA